MYSLWPPHSGAADATWKQHRRCPKWVPPVTLLVAGEPSDFYVPTRAARKSPFWSDIRFKVLIHHALVDEPVNCSSCMYCSLNVHGPDSWRWIFVTFCCFYDLGRLFPSMVSISVWCGQLMISVLIPTSPLAVYTYAYSEAEILICWHVNLETCLL